MTNIVQEHLWLKVYLDGLDRTALARLAVAKLTWGHFSPDMYGRQCLVGAARGVRTTVTQPESGFQADISQQVHRRFDALATRYDPLDVECDIRSYVLQRLQLLNVEAFLADVHSNRPAIKEPSLRPKLIAIGLALLACVGLSGCTTSVDSTEHCTLTRYGTIIERHMGTGLHWTPFTSATCFSMVDHNWPASSDPHAKETLDAQTADPVTVSSDLAIIYAFDPLTVDSVFLEKRSAEAAEIEILNAVRSGYRNAIAGWRVADIFSSRRPALDDSVRAAIQRKIGRKAEIKQVFLRDIRAPQAIEEARIAAVRQAQILNQQQSQFTIDSVKARSTIVAAQAQATSQKLLADAYAQNPQLLGLKRAEAMSKVCGQATTCILGQQFLASWGAAETK